MPRSTPLGVKAKRSVNGLMRRSDQRPYEKPIINNPELGNSLEQRLSEITRRLTLNTQAKLSAAKMTSTDMPPAWQGRTKD